jgi:hypothetical protein
VTNRDFGSLTTLAILVAMASLTQAPVAGQRPASDASPNHAAKTWTPSRTPDGQPDVRGMWSRRVVGAGYSLESGSNAEHLLLSAGCAQGIVGCERSAEELNAINGGRRGENFVSIIVDPPDGKVPYQPWAAAKRQGITDHHTNPRGLGDVDPQARCLLSGVPRMNYQEMTAIQIHQIPGYVLINAEFNHNYRVIPLDGRPHIGEHVKLWMGDSRGRWEGNTLVVDVTNHNDRTWFDIVGTFHSDALHVVERWTFVDADTINYEATIEDPTVFTRPWKMAFPIQRRNEPGFELLEMACHEGERSFNLMLGK